MGSTGKSGRQDAAQTGPTDRTLGRAPRRSCRPGTYVITRRGQPVDVPVPAKDTDAAPEEQESREEALAALFRLGEEISRKRVTDKPSVDILFEMRR